MARASQDRALCERGAGGRHSGGLQGRSITQLLKTTPSTGSGLPLCTARSDMLVLGHSVLLQPPAPHGTARGPKSLMGSQPSWRDRSGPGHSLQHPTGRPPSRTLAWRIPSWAA